MLPKKVALWFSLWYVSSTDKKPIGSLFALKRFFETDFCRQKVDFWCGLHTKTTIFSTKKAQNALKAQTCTDIYYHFYRQ